MQTGNKFKAIIQTKELENNLIYWMNAAKYVYNAKVGENLYYYKFLKWSLNDTGAERIPVTAQYTSQECSQCGFISKGNRKTQADFACQSCDYSDNADSNASYVIKKKGVEMVYNKSFTFKEKKKVSIRKNLGKVVALHDVNHHDMPCIIHANGELCLE